MTIDAQLVVNEPNGALTISILVRGEIMKGDAVALEKAISAADRPDILAIFVIFDSPGGSLYEGMAIGQVLSKYPKATIGRVEGICASACTFAFIGAQYRVVGQAARIGVHQFSFSESSEDQLFLGQVASADVAKFLVKQGIDLEFFQRTSATSAEGIYWVSEPELWRWGVLTGIVKQEAAEIEIVAGQATLALIQESVFGEYSLTLTCKNGTLVGIATLQDPERPEIGSLTLGLDGLDHVIPQGQWRIEQVFDGKTSFSFRLPGSVGDLASKARRIGAFVYDASQTKWYGFEVNVTNNAQFAVLRGCSTS